MTIKTRNWIFIFGAACIAVMFMSLLWLSVRLIMANPSYSNRIFSIPANSQSRTALKGTFFSLCSFIVLLFVFMYFRRTASAEVFFFFLYLITYPQEGMLSFISLLSHYQLPVYFIQMGYRAYFFLQFIGTFSLFSAGLFSTNLQYTKLEISLGVVILAAFTLSAFIPIDTALSAMNMSYFKEVLYLLIGIKILSIINMFLAGYRQNSIDYIWVGVGTLMLIISREIHFYLSGAGWFWMAVILFTSGCILFLNRLHKIYQWL